MRLLITAAILSLSLSRPRPLIAITAKTTPTGPTLTFTIEALPMRPRRVGAAAVADW